VGLALSLNDVISIEKFQSFQNTTASESDKYVMFSHMCKQHLNTHLNNGDNCSKLVHFIEEKHIFSTSKNPSLSGVYTTANIALS
jgi:hypothetical protein